MAMLLVVEDHALVPAPPSAIWPLVSEVDPLPQWFALAESAELLGGSGVSRRQRIHGHWGKRRSEVDEVVTDFEPERRVAWRREAERLGGKPAPRFAAETRFEIVLEPRDGATMVRRRSEQVPAGAVRGLVMRWFGRRELAAALRRSLERLRARVAEE